MQPEKRGATLLKKIPRVSRIFYRNCYLRVRGEEGGCTARTLFVQSELNFMCNSGRKQDEGRQEKDVRASVSFQKTYAEKKVGLTNF